MWNELGCRVGIKQDVDGLWRLLSEDRILLVSRQLFVMGEKEDPFLSETLKDCS